jgi:hypothetical protein
MEFSDEQVQMLHQLWFMPAKSPLIFAEHDTFY